MGENEERLRETCERGDLVSIRRLVEKEGALVQAKDEKSGRTPLMLASCMGNVDVVHFLLERGADVKAKDREGWTALMYAASEGHLEIAKLLVEKCRESLKQTCLGWKKWSALAFAAKNGHDTLVKWMLEFGADTRVDGGSTLLMQLCLSGKAGVETLRGLMASPTDVSASDEGGSTLLMHFARILGRMWVTYDAWSWSLLRR